MILKCARCEKQLEGNDVVHVINRFVWCEECFNYHILPQMTMSVDDYFKSASPASRQSNVG